MEDETIIDMEVLGHEHPIVLVDLQPEYPQYEEYHDDEDEDDEEENEWNKKWELNHTCNLCSQEINLYHRYYYKCECECCDYFLHKSCAELPKELKNGSHRRIGHSLSLSKVHYRRSPCWICEENISGTTFYECTKCFVQTHVKCVVAHKANQTIYHPSHPHPLVSITSQPVLHECRACGTNHEGILYHCTTCVYIFSIQSDCVFLPKKLQYRRHIHPLILSYSFPIAEQSDKFNPMCRVCRGSFHGDDTLWIYKCERCRYYVHLHCVKSLKGPDKFDLFSLYQSIMAS